MMEDLKLPSLLGPRTFKTSAPPVLTRQRGSGTRRVAGNSHLDRIQNRSHPFASSVAGKLCDSYRVL